MVVRLISKRRFYLNLFLFSYVHFICITVFSQEGHSALAVAAHNGQCEAARLLLMHGAHVDSQDYVR